MCSIFLSNKPTTVYPLVLRLSHINNSPHIHFFLTFFLLETHTSINVALNLISISISLYLMEGIGRFTYLKIVWPFLIYLLRGGLKDSLHYLINISLFEYLLTNKEFFFFVHTIPTKFSITLQTRPK